MLHGSMSGQADAALGSLRSELEEAKGLIGTREGELEQLKGAIADARIRRRELDALRSAALVDHLRKHAEEAEQSRALEVCRKAIDSAWARIKQLQLQRADVGATRMQHERANKHLKQMKAAHEEEMQRVEAVATLPERLLEAECATISDALSAIDAQRGGAAIADDEEAADGELRRTVLTLLQRLGPADAGTLHLQMHPRDEAASTQETHESLGRLHRVLKQMQDGWEVFEVTPGRFASL